MKRHTKLLAAAATLAFLCACAGGQPLQDESVLTDLTAQLGEITVDGVPLDLRTAEPRLDARRTEEPEGVDTADCTIVATEENYTITAGYRMTYRLAENDTWKLDSSVRLYEELAVNNFPADLSIRAVSYMAEHYTECEVLGSEKTRQPQSVAYTFHVWQKGRLLETTGLVEIRYRLVREGAGSYVWRGKADASGLSYDRSGLVGRWQSTDGTRAVTVAATAGNNLLLADCTLLPAGEPGSWYLLQTDTQGTGICRVGSGQLKAGLDSFWLVEEDGTQTLLRQV